MAAGSLLGIVPAGASGGGMCTAPIKTARGTVVEMNDFCFTPTVLRVGVGEKVKWINRENVSHVVIGANGSWGTFDEDLGKHETVTYWFRRPGIYPYTCYYHVGMNGVVVAGKYKGASADSAAPRGGEVTTEPSPHSPETIERPVPVAIRVVRAGSAEGWQAGTFVGFGLFLAAAVGFAVQRRTLRRLEGSGRD